MYGHKKAPAWIVEMEIAKEWRLPPYKLTGGTKTLWYARQEAIREAQIKQVHYIESKRKQAELK